MTLKKIILKMTEDDINLRPNLFEMQTYLKEYSSLAR